MPRLLRILCITSCVVAVGTVPAHAASSVVGETISVDRCLGFPLRDGVHRQSVNADVNQSISGIPPRVAGTFGPGESGRICVGFQNTTGKPIDLELTTADVAADDDGVPLVGVENATYGASSWIKLPARRVDDLRQGEIAWLVVDVRVPDDAAPGSWYSNITAASPVAPSTTSSDGPSQVVSSPAVAIQVFFDIPGEGTRGGVIQNVRAPRVIWWDGLHFGRVDFLEKLRGLSLATIRFEWQNRGSYSDGVKARIVIRSALSGREVETIDVPEGIVLRGVSRKFSGTWDDHIPLVGRFTPTLEVTGTDGKVTKRELDSIWVIPSWLYLLALVVAVGIPIWMRVRSRRRYRELLARLDAAEAKSTDDPDDWDDERY